MSFPSHDHVIDQIIHETLSQGWSLRPQVLSSSELAEINCFFDGHRGSFKAARVGKGSDRVRKEEIRGDHTLWLDLQNPPQEFQKILALLEQLKLRLNRELILGIKEYECHLAYYAPGTFYKTHIDRFSKDSSRVYSFVLYLHQEWQPEWGGELVLYDRQGNTLKKISPLPGSVVTFLSDDFPHEVRASQRERRSLTGWMHTKIIT